MNKQQRQKQKEIDKRERKFLKEHGINSNVVCEVLPKKKDLEIMEISINQT